MASPCAESLGDMKVWDSELGLQGGERFVKLKHIVPLKYIEYGFGYIIIRSPCTPYSIYLRGTIGFERFVKLNMDLN